MGRLVEIAVGEKSEELRALFRAAAKDTIYALVEAEFAKLPAMRDASTVAWLRRAMREDRWVRIGDALMDYALVRDDKVRQDGRAAAEADVARLVQELMPRFIALDL